MSFENTSFPKRRNRAHENPNYIENETGSLSNQTVNIS